MEKHEVNFVYCSLQTDVSLEDVRQILGNRVSVSRGTRQDGVNPEDFIALVGTRIAMEIARDELYMAGLACAVNNPFTRIEDLQDVFWYEQERVDSDN